jgi:protein-S-isoprenylcysteine O-methyltransferase Ste14
MGVRCLLRRAGWERVIGAAGIILAMIGTTIAVSLYWLVAVVLLGAYFVYSAIAEERFMAGRFPDSYPEYKRSTKMLIPFIF